MIDAILAGLDTFRARKRVAALLMSEVVESAIGVIPLKRLFAINTAAHFEFAFEEITNVVVFFGSLVGVLIAAEGAIGGIKLQPGLIFASEFYC